MIRLDLDGHACELKAFHNLSWLKDFGRVFCVFDRLISGNLCFGVASGRERYFIKYAGAPALNYSGAPLAAEKRLREAEAKYARLRHPRLIQPLRAFDTPEGFGLVFPWYEGYALSPLEAHMASLRSLPVRKRLELFDGLADFLLNASRCDYIAGGFSDRHILFSAEKEDTTVCSVDRMMLMPAFTPFPKMPGSAWYVPPEGYAPGARLDEQSNVYVMGALAFTFLGNRTAMDGAGWEADRALYAVAKKAVSKAREERQASASEFLGSWRDTVMRLPMA